MLWYRRFLPLLVIVIALGLVALGWSLFRPGPEFAGTKIEPHKDLSTLRLLNTDGGEASFVPQKRQLNLVFFGFTACPDICPTTLSLVRDAKAELRNQAQRVDVTLVSVDPARDTAPVLKTYVEQFIPTAKGLRTDDDAQLRHVATAFGASYQVTMSDKPMAHGNSGQDHGASSHGHGDDAASTEPTDSMVPQVSHTTWLYAVNDEGKLIAQWPMGVTKTQLANDLRTLL